MRARVLAWLRQPASGAWVLLVPGVWLVILVIVVI